MDIWIFWMFLSIILLDIPNSRAGKSDLWDYCNCKWAEWQSWGDCSNECNGGRTREREVSLYRNKDGCPFEGSTCATWDMFYDNSGCNTFCHNGGSSDTYRCTCVTGYYGSCCGFQVDCGDPGLIENGKVHGGTIVYGANISYTCNSNYILIDGSSQRTCQLNSLWSGNKPYCAYYNSCGSDPCKNGGSCSNLFDDYLCTCATGWSGKDCDIDVQPPVVVNCSNDVSITTSKTSVHVEWPIPIIFDPHNFPIEISSNYPSEGWTFPWGDFHISYSVFKPSNGLRNGCVFTIHIRPHMCPSLASNIPINGAILCNKWKRDYGQFCRYMCIEPYTVPRGIDPNVWYVCGATGSWVPSIVPNCSVNTNTLQSFDGYNIAERIATCTEENTMIKTGFIEKLNLSSFNYFCDQFSDECLTKNVMVKCSRNDSH